MNLVEIHQRPFWLVTAAILPYRFNHLVVVYGSSTYIPQSHGATWRIIPFSKWLVTPTFINHLKPFTVAHLEGVPRNPILSGLMITMVVNHVSVQVLGWSSKHDPILWSKDSGEEWPKKGGPSGVPRLVHGWVEFARVIVSYGNCPVSNKKS